MTGFKHKKDSEGIVTITIDMEGKVNKIDDFFIEELQSTLKKLEKSDIKGVIITSGKEVFIAGADLKLLATATDPKVIFDMIERLKSSLRRLEKLGKPVVAAINGSVFGGGFEVCLSCHHRIALNDPKMKIGLPETSLGLLPGGGGTVRMIHLLGPEVAVPFILEAKLVSPAEALNLKLVDEIAKTPEELIEKAKAWIRKNPEAAQPWDRPDHRIPGDHKQYIHGAPPTLYKKTKGAFPAHEQVLKVAFQTLMIQFDAAQRSESRALAKLVTSPEGKNMIETFFFQMHQGSTHPKHLIKKLGILGGGMMGRAIAYVAALSGIDVIIKEIDQETADKAKEFSKKNEEAFSRITATADYNDLQGCDLIIEAVFENKDVKAEVTKAAESKLPKGGIFASNTSSLPITELAKATKKPENFIGIHFFSPVEKMKLVEIIVGEKTSEETLTKAVDFALQLKKIPIVVNDSPGFFTTRVISKYIDEAVEMLVEGVHPARIERVARQAGFPAGPLSIWDEVSQKLFHMIAKANDQTTGNTYKVADLMINKYNRGGRAHGGGIYEYPSNGFKFIWPEIIRLYYKPNYKITDQEIKDRFLFIQSLEAIRCMEEGVIRQVRDANIGSIFGIGYPTVTGGVIQHVNGYGLKKFKERAAELEKKFGTRFAAPKMLLEKKENL